MTNPPNKSLVGTFYRCAARAPQLSRYLSDSNAHVL
jgi:hypothetical protein